MISLIFVKTILNINKTLVIERLLKAKVVSCGDDEIVTKKFGTAQVLCSLHNSFELSILLYWSIIEVVIINRLLCV